MRLRVAAPRTAAFILLAVVALAMAVVPAAPAAAHATLISTDPAEGAVLEEAPDEVRFTFNEDVIGVPAGIAVFDATGAEVASSATVRTSQLVVALDEEVGEGTLVVLWRLVSADGHPISGSLSFSVGEASGVVDVPTTTADASTEAPLLLSVLRWIGYLGLLVAAGVALFAVLVLPGERTVDDARARLLPIARLAAGAAALAWMLAVPLVALYQLGLPAGALGEASTWVALAPGEYVVPAVVVLGLAVAVGCLRTTPLDRSRTAVVLAGCVLALASPALTGHTRAATPQALVVGVDVLHLVAGATWLGGLVALALTLPGLAARDQSGAQVLARFSSRAAAVVALLVVSGSFLAWRIAGSWDALLDTGYGALLLTKVVAALVAIALAVWNRFSLLPRLAAAVRRKDRRSSAAVLARTTLAEAGVLVVVLAVTGLLVDRSPEPAVAVTSPTYGGQVARQEVRLGDIDAVVILEPLGVGPATITIEMTGADGAPAEGYEAPRISLSTPGVDLGGVVLVNLGPGVYAGDVVVPTGGTWTAQVSLRTTEFDNPVRSTRFEVP